MKFLLRLKYVTTLHSELFGPFSADGGRRSGIFVPLCSTQSRRLLIYKVVSTADLLSKQSLVVMFDLSWLVD